MLHYDTTGSCNQTPVLFLHGFMGRGSDWQPIIETMRDRAYCIAVDLPGHGASVNLPDAAYTMDAAVQQLVDVLEAEDIAQCVVVGYSMGGRTALQMALHHPERCGRLVLESASPGLDTEAQRANRRRLDQSRARQITSDYEAFLHSWYQMPLFASLAHHGLVETMIERRHHNRPEELVKSLQGMGTGAQASHWERMAALRISTLAVTGALDSKYVGITQRMTALNPRIQSVIVPGAGHNVHAERPHAFIAQLRCFID